MEMFAEKTVILKLENGDEIEAEKALHYSSGTIKDYLRTQSDDHVELPIVNSPTYQADIKDFEVLNAFFSYIDKNMHDQLREHAEEQNYWIEKLEEDKRSLVKLVEKVPEDTLIRCSNLGDYLIAKQFVIFCSMVLHERVRTLKLTDLRTKFNEVDDFSERQREIIDRRKDM